jgi:hypothetical protein
MIYQNVPHHSRIVTSTLAAVEMSKRLIWQSVYFVMRPLPNDQWEFSVKKESQGLLDWLVNDLRLKRISE